jgi:DNA-binding NarL/FixJ family response regulator
MTHDEDCDFEDTRLNSLETSSREAPLNGRSSQPVLASATSASAWLFAAASDAGQPQTFDLARLWEEARAGTWRFRDTFSTAERHFAIVEKVEQVTAAPARSRVQARNLEILERVLLGQAPKVTAAEMGIGLSTVATGTRDSLLWMGLDCRIANAPVMLTMATCAACRTQSVPTLGRLTRINANEDKYWLISVWRPDLLLPVALSSAESMVVRQLVAGRTHHEISSQRATSPRTIANQLATAFRKFGVSGRTAVLHQLIAYSVLSRAATAGDDGSAGQAMGG